MIGVLPQINKSIIGDIKRLQVSKQTIQNLQTEIQSAHWAKKAERNFSARGKPGKLYFKNDHMWTYDSHCGNYKVVLYQAEDNPNQFYFWRIFARAFELGDYHEFLNEICARWANCNMEIYNQYFDHLFSFVHKLD